MGSNNICHVILLMSWLLLLLLLLPSKVRGSSHTLDRDLLDSFIHDYAIKNMTKRYTGKLYNISLPTNFSGMETSIIRFRSGSFWRKGAKFSFFHIPPSVLPWPFVKRFDIIYENLGNWSSKYYDVPNYTFVTPVIGFLAFDANRSRENYGMVELNIMANHILVHFPHISLPQDQNKNVTMKCVRFVTNGSIEFSNVTMNNSCISRGQGHFSIVIPSLKPEEKEKKRGQWKWWVIGFGVGVVGLILLIFIGILVYKCVRLKRRKKMERQSEKSEALDTVWVGNSRMPSASGIRTQPVLENSYVP
ncbi:PREDICTED: uncharacterized protein LOC109208836 [Nicotiana attenuata]|uniref:Uncharacterized protein n=1 Tax=Nicotiana attenuata TaxID=49451 RepID=A0A314KPS6_NICAT|nr:PREDICTED: uncharacterized protein LOC109208836 [Nicotiana attenuata]OIT31330.1 hypothetical protein A4A49_42003 [Nicotiana attenuata]